MLVVSGIAFPATYTALTVLHGYNITCHKESSFLVESPINIAILGERATIAGWCWTPVQRTSARIAFWGNSRWI